MSRSTTKSASSTVTARPRNLYKYVFMQFKCIRFSILTANNAVGFQCVFFLFWFVSYVDQLYYTKIYIENVTKRPIIVEWGAPKEDIRGFSAYFVWRKESLTTCCHLAFVYFLNIFFYWRYISADAFFHLWSDTKSMNVPICGRTDQISGCLLDDAFRISIKGYLFLFSSFFCCAVVKVH